MSARRRKAAQSPAEPVYGTFRDPEVTVLVAATDAVTAEMLNAVADLRAITDEIRDYLDARRRAVTLHEQDYVIALMEIHCTDPDADLLTALDKMPDTD